MNSFLLAAAIAAAVPGQAVSAPDAGPSAIERLLNRNASAGVWQPVSAEAAAPVAPKVSDVPVFDAVPERRPFQSDHAFDNFIGPVSNPIYSKDPRSNTYARFLYVDNVIPGGHPFQGGSLQAVAMQVNIALTERVSFIADKDGYAFLNPGNAPATNGFLNLAAGLKYTFWRDVENRTLAAAGFMYEIPTGEADVFQNHGPGNFTIFATGGKQIGDYWHVLDTAGYQFGLQGSTSSNFFYNSLHIDRQVCGWFYPLAELNLFQYTSGGNRGLPTALGEGDGLLNLGTSGVAGNTLVTAAIGAKAVLSQSAILGAAWEFPLTGRHDLISNRLTVEFILRY